MAKGLNNFYRGTTVNFRGSITVNGSTPDISGDAVTFTMKVNKDDADPGVFQKTADVITEGPSGTVIFEFTKAETNIEERTYAVDIKWELATGEEYVLHEQSLIIQKRVSDV